MTASLSEEDPEWLVGKKDQNYGTVSSVSRPSPDSLKSASSLNGASDSDLHRVHLRLFAFVLALCGAVLSEGYDVGVLNGVLVRVQDEFHLSALEIAVIVTTTPVCVIPGSMLGGWAADKFGRRPALLITVILLIVGPFIMACAWDSMLLLMGRSIVGLGIGFGLVLASMYVAETAPGELRGKLITFEDICFNMGMLLGYFVNWALVGIENDWRCMLGIGSLLPLPLLVYLLCGCIPESPRWLLLHGRHDEALAVLERFTGKSEAASIVATWEQPVAEIPLPKIICPSNNLPLRRMVVAGTVVGVAQTGCGYLAVAYYSSKVMTRVMDEKTAFFNTMIMGFIKTIFVVIAVLILDRVGRRALLLLSTAGCAAGCVWIAVTFVHSSTWMIAAGFWFFMASFSLGLGPVVWVYLAEVFPIEVRGKAMGVVIFVSRVVGTLSTLGFPLLTESIGVPSTFSLLTVINIALFGLLWAFARETQGFSLENVKKVFM